MYFSLINDITYDSSKTISDPVDLPIEFDLMAGHITNIPVKTPLEFTTNAKQGDDLRDFLRGSFTLMSAKLLNLFLAAGVDNLQTFPAVIRSDEDGYIWDNYFAVNVIGIIACADLSKSTYSEIMPGHYRFKELAIDANKARDALMFRLQEHSPTIIIHRSVGRYIKENDPEKTLKGWTVAKIIQ